MIEKNKVEVLLTKQYAPGHKRFDISHIAAISHVTSVTKSYETSQKQRKNRDNYKMENGMV